MWVILRNTQTDGFLTVSSDAACFAAACFLAFVESLRNEADVKRRCVYVFYTQGLRENGGHGGFKQRINCVCVRLTHRSTPSADPTPGW